MEMRSQKEAEQGTEKYSVRSLNSIGKRWLSPSQKSSQLDRSFLNEWQYPSQVKLICSIHEEHVLQYKRMWIDVVDLLTCCDVLWWAKRFYYPYRRQYSSSDTPFHSMFGENEVPQSVHNKLSPNSSLWSDATTFSQTLHRKRHLQGHRTFVQQPSSAHAHHNMGVVSDQNGWKQSAQRYRFHLFPYLHLRWNDTIPRTNLNTSLYKRLWMSNGSGVDRTAAI